MAVNNYLVSVFEKGKRVYSYYSEALDELCTIRAIYRDCEIQIFNVVECERLSERQVEIETTKACRRWKNAMSGHKIPIAESVRPQAAVKPRTKKQWERQVMCTETGQIFRSIRECSDKTGIPYMTITNCIKNGNATRGVHFTNAPQDE